jgi:hypothetical protein
MMDFSPSSKKQKGKTNPTIVIAAFVSCLRFLFGRQMRSLRAAEVLLFRRSCHFQEISYALRILNVSIECDQSELKRAYKDLVLTNHPDTGGTSTRMVDITKSYQLLRSLSKQEICEYKHQIATGRTRKGLGPSLRQKKHEHYEGNSSRIFASGMCLCALFCGCGFARATQFGEIHDPQSESGTNPRTLSRSEILVNERADLNKTISSARVCALYSEWLSERERAQLQKLICGLYRARQDLDAIIDDCVRSQVSESAA